MLKIKIKSCLKSDNNVYDNIYYGLLDNKKITYYEGDIKVKVAFDDSHIIIERSNEQYHLKLKLINGENTSSTYILKPSKQIINLNVLTKELIINNCELIARYVIEQENEIDLHIKYEVIE
ncbi:MAG: hypothetical protein PHE54_02715 [Bacilli bacterium]|nr:hypothetical protein [Bacilli bacterium]